VRRIVSKLIKRCGAAFVNRTTPEYHRPMIAYIEKLKRKKINKIQKEKLLALIGGKDVGDGDEAVRSGANANDSSDESSDDDQQVRGDGASGAMQANKAGPDADMSDSDSEDDDVAAGPGTDLLQAPELDIPRVDDIPVVSQLAKQTEAEKLEEMDGEQQLEYKRQVNREQIAKIIEHDEDHLETHFVENPYIKLRERAS